MIDYNTFTINTNIILLFNNIFSNLFYTIIFINYCNFYKLYTQCWPLGPTRFLSMAHSMVQCTLLCIYIPLSFFQRKTLYINCVHNRIFPKNWGGGGQIHYCPPPIWIGGGGHGPPRPPYSGPHDWKFLYYSMQEKIIT